MNKARLFTWIGLSGLAVLLVVGFLEVLERRFAEGDVYPHYASFRNDPLGTSAFYEALERLEGVQVSRNIVHLNTVPGLTDDTVLLLIGYPREGFRDLRAPGDSAVMEAVENGARLVITTNPGLVPEKFEPVRTEEEEDWFERRRKLREKLQRERENPSEEETPSEEEESEGAGKAESRKIAKKKETAPPTKKVGNGERKDRKETSAEPDEEDTAEEPDDEEKTVEAKPDSPGDSDEDVDEEEKLEREMDSVLGERLTRVLGFQIESLEEFDRPDGGWEVFRGDKPGKGAPRAFPSWYSQFHFASLSEEWRVIGTREEEPVVIERPFGKGTVVLISDSFFASNEALHSEPISEFLVWLLGGKKNIVFDETIHGVRETGGAMKLMRRYRVHGIFFGLLAFVILWAWRSSSALAPGSDDLDRGLVSASGGVAGEDTGLGLIRLLRRSVPKEDLISRCIGLWKDGQARDVPPELEEKIASIERSHRSSPKEFTVTKAYEAISSVLRRR